MNYTVICVPNIFSKNNNHLLTESEYYTNISRIIFNRISIELTMRKDRLSKIVYNDFGLELDRNSDVDIMYDHNGDIKNVEQGEFHLIVNDEYYFIFNRDPGDYREKIIDKII